MRKIFRNNKKQRELLISKWNAKLWSVEFSFVVVMKFLFLQKISQMQTCERTLQILINKRLLYLNVKISLPTYMVILLTIM